MPLIKLNATQGLTGTLPAVSGANLTGITAGGLVLISATTISSGDAEVELTFSSSYDNYRIIISNAVPNSTGSGAYIKVIVKRSGQGSYDTSAGNYWYNGYDMYTANNTDNNAANKNASSGQLLAWNQNNTTYNGNYNIIEIGAVNQNTYHMFDCFSQQLQYGNNGDNHAMSHYHFVHTQASPLTNIKLLPHSGNFKSGKVLFYGYRES